MSGFLRVFLSVLCSVVNDLDLRWQKECESKNAKVVCSTLNVLDLDLDLEMTYVGRILPYILLDSHIGTY